MDRITRQPFGNSSNLNRVDNTIRLNSSSFLLTPQRVRQVEQEFMQELTGELIRRLTKKLTQKFQQQLTQAIIPIEINIDLLKEESLKKIKDLSLDVVQKELEQETIQNAVQSKVLNLAEEMHPLYFSEFAAQQMMSRLNKRFIASYLQRCVQKNISSVTQIVSVTQENIQKLLQPLQSEQEEPTVEQQVTRRNRPRSNAFGNADDIAIQTRPA
jgi:uncharacterized membrane-anchored protein YjiN (DUF445 family)